MSTHIAATKGQIADTVLMPGDPLRAKYIAQNFLTNSECYNNVRGMLGYTGLYKGKQISVQGSGMGIPSFLIYSTELIKEYDVKNIIRVGTCGGLCDNIKVRDIIIAMSTCTTSAINKTRFLGYDFAPTASFELLNKAYNKTKELDIDSSRIHVGSILSSDEFYVHDDMLQRKFADYGILGVEMEAAGLYTVAAQYHIKALAIMTVSDHIFTGESTSADERETTFNEMIQIALETSL